MCILSEYIAKSCWLLLFECSAHVSDGFAKKVWMEVGGWGELYPRFLDFLNFLTLRSPLLII